MTKFCTNSRQDCHQQSYSLMIVYNPSGVNHLTFCRTLDVLANMIFNACIVMELKVRILFCVIRLQIYRHFFVIITESGYRIDHLAAQMNSQMAGS